MNALEEIIDYMKNYYDIIDRNDNDNDTFKKLNTHSFKSINKKVSIWFKYKCKNCNNNLNDIIPTINESVLSCDEMIIKNILE